MRFGLWNAPAISQRIVNVIVYNIYIFRDGLGRYVLGFLDDILICNRTQEGHTQHIRAVLKRLRYVKGSGRVNKHNFLCTELEHSGFDMRGYGVKPSFSRIKAAPEWSTISSLKMSGIFSGAQALTENFSHFPSKIIAPWWYYQERKIGGMGPRGQHSKGWDIIQEVEGSNDDGFHSIFSRLWGVYCE